jgi:type I restriction enzyme S subunit
MKNRGTGVAIPGLNSTAVKELTFLLPAREVIAHFADTVDPLILKIWANCNMMRTLSLLRNTLLPRLISGKLRLQEAERLVEAVL